jgi:soluble lytic murein transglycosylase-like protein
MVMRFWLTLGLAVAAGPVQAQDWASAGGALFFAQESVAPPETPAADATLPTTVLASQPYADLVADAAAAQGLDPKLLHAVNTVECAYQAAARSAAPGGGAAGLTQLMPHTARELGVQDRFDPTENVFGGAQYLAAQIRRFGDVRLALAAYNAGPSRVARLGRAPDFPETRDYVVKVVDCYLALTAGRSIRSARDCPTAEPAP